MEAHAGSSGIPDHSKMGKHPGFSKYLNPQRPIQVSPAPLSSAWVRKGALCGHTKQGAHTQGQSSILHPSQKLAQCQMSTAGGWARARLLSFPRPSQCWLIRGIQVRWEGHCCSWPAKDRAGSCEVNRYPLSHFPWDTFPSQPLSATSLQS